MWILKSLRRPLRALLCLFLLGTATIATSAPASAHAKSFDVTSAGVQLLNGTFESNGHINVKFSDHKTFNVHFEAKCIDATASSNPECFGTVPNKSAQAKYIGKSFIPWSALGKAPSADACLVWAQVGQEQYHFGENGEAPYCGSTPPVAPPENPQPTPKPTATPTPEPTPSPTDQPSEPPLKEPQTEPTANPSPSPKSPKAPIVPQNPSEQPVTVVPKPPAPGADIPVNAPPASPQVEDTVVELASDAVRAGTKSQVVNADLPQGITSEQVNSLGVVTSWKEVDNNLTVTPDLIETEYATASGLAETGLSTPTLIFSAFALGLLFIGTLTFKIARRKEEV